MSEVYIGIERGDGTVAHMAFQTDGRFPSKPIGVGWAQFGNGTWGRAPTDASIQAEVDRQSRAWAALGDAAAASWKRLSGAEHETFNRHRHHRDALEMVGGVIRHNMPKARELHRHLLRHQRAEKLLILDAAFNGATARGDQARAAALEAIRAELRDLTDDPRIDAAQTIDQLVAVGFTQDAEIAMDQLRNDIKNAGA